MKRAVDPLERIAQLEKMLARARRDLYKQRARALMWRERAMARVKRIEDLQRSVKRWQVRAELKNSANSTKRSSQ